MAMHTDADILTLTQWLSPAYPVGAFSYSHGLEWAVQSGQVTEGTSLGVWLADVLRHGSGWSDCLFLVAAYCAQDKKDLAGIDADCRAFAPSRERLQESDLQGAAFCDTTARVWRLDLRGLTYPVALGRAAQLADLPLGLSAAMYLQAVTSNLIAAAMRLGPLGQTQGQALLRQLTPVCRKVANAACGGNMDELSSTAFLSDIASMQHETQYSRIFRT